LEDASLFSFAIISLKGQANAIALPHKVREEVSDVSIFGFLFMIVKEIGVLVSHLKNQSYPQPLSEDEEREALKRLEEGDREARNKLIEHNLRLVAHITKRYARSSEEQEEMLSIGTYGLIKAIDTYNMQKGTKLATYAAKCIQNEILMHLRSNKKSQNDVSIYDPIGMDKEGNEISLIDVLPSDEEDIGEKVEIRLEKKEMQRFLHILDDREREVLIRRFGLAGDEEQTQRQVADILGISRSYVSRIEKRALTKMYQAYMKSLRKHRDDRLGSSS